MSTHKSKKAAAKLGPRVTIKVDELIAALRFAPPAMGREETRYYLCGIFLTLETDGLRIQACDGHRLHCTVFDTIKAKGTPHSMLLGRDTVAAILKTYKSKRDRNGTATIDYALGSIAIGADTHKKTDGHIDLRRIIPRNPTPAFAIISGLGLLSFVNAVHGANESSRGNCCKFSLSEADARLEASARHRPHGADNTVHVTTTIDNCAATRTCEVGYSAVYVRDIIKAFGITSPLWVGFECPNSPSLWHAGESKSQFVVLMPMRV